MKKKCKSSGERTRNKNDYYGREYKQQKSLIARTLKVFALKIFPYAVSQGDDGAADNACCCTHKYLLLRIFILHTRQYAGAAAAKSVCKKQFIRRFGQLLLIFLKLGTFQVCDCCSFDVRTTHSLADIFIINWTVSLSKHINQCQTSFKFSRSVVVEKNKKGFVVVGFMAHGGLLTRAKIKRASLSHSGICTIIMRRPKDHEI